MVSTKELPDEIYCGASKKGLYRLYRFIKEKYGIETLHKMQEEKVNCPYCNEEKNAWIFTGSCASRHTRYCIIRLIEEEKVAVKAGWLTVGNDVITISDLDRCITCKNYVIDNRENQPMYGKRMCKITRYYIRRELAKRWRKCKNYVKDSKE